jgi:putative flippase GtrA
VHIVRTATDDLKGVWRVGRALATGSLPLDRLARPFGDDPRDREIQDVPRGLARQLVGFCVVGGLSTLFYLLLYSAFRQFSGSQVANALALLVSAVANTAANRRLTFGVRGRGGAVRHQAQGLVVFAIGLALTSGSLAALNAAGGSPAHSTELAVLIAANLAATVLRFLLFRAWVFPDRPEDGPHFTVAAHSPSAHAPSACSPSPYATSAYTPSTPARATASSPTYATTSAPAHATPAPYRPDGPLPRRPLPHPAYGHHETTAQVRAGEAADGTWRDGTLPLQPVRPHDTDPGDPR